MGTIKVVKDGDNRKVYLYRRTPQGKRLVEHFVVPKKDKPAMEAALAQAFAKARPVTDG